MNGLDEALEQLDQALDQAQSTREAEALADASNILIKIKDGQDISGIVFGDLKPAIEILTLNNREDLDEPIEALRQANGDDLSSRNIAKRGW